MKAPALVFVVSALLVAACTEVYTAVTAPGAPPLDGADRLPGDRPPPIVWSTISAGQLHGCGLIQTGAAYCWGRNDRGQLGDGTTTPRLLPAAVTGAHTFVSISSGNNMTCALKADGTAWCWGNNGSGRLGSAHPRTSSSRHV